MFDDHSLIASSWTSNFHHIFSVEANSLAGEKFLSAFLSSKQWGNSSINRFSIIDRQIQQLFYPRNPRRKSKNGLGFSSRSLRLCGEVFSQETLHYKKQIALQFSN